MILYYIYYNISQIILNTFKWPSFSRSSSSNTIYPLLILLPGAAKHVESKSLSLMATPQRNSGGLEEELL